MFEKSNSCEIKVDAYIDIPIDMKIDVFLKNLNKCQASVVKTKNVVEPQNLGLEVLPGLYLFTQLLSGSQNVCLYLSSFQKILLS